MSITLRPRLHHLVQGIKNLSSDRLLLPRGHLQAPSLTSRDHSLHPILHQNLSLPLALSASTRTPSPRAPPPYPQAIPPQCRQSSRHIRHASLIDNQCPLLIKLSNRPSFLNSHHPRTKIAYSLPRTQNHGQSLACITTRIYPQAPEYQITAPIATKTM